MITLELEIDEARELYALAAFGRSQLHDEPTSAHTQPRTASGAHRAREREHRRNNAMRKLDTALKDAGR